jgi:hypothetical protein
LQPVNRAVMAITAVNPAMVFMGQGLAFGAVSGV